MITVNQQVKIPNLMADSSVNPMKENSVGTDGFLSFFSKSLNKPLHTLKDSTPMAERGSKPLQSTRSAVREEAASRMEARETNAADQSQPGKEVLESKDAPRSETEITKADTAARTEQKSVDASEADRVDESKEQSEVESENVATMELTQKSEQLLAVMDEIIKVLQQAAQPTQAGNTENTPETLNISSKAMQLGGKLQSLLQDLVTAAEQLEGTKTANQAMGFAKKLQQLLGDDSLKALEALEGLEVSVGGSITLEELAGKMLHEAENAKMHLVQTSLQEITIPAMKAEAPKAPVQAEAPKASEETDAQAPVQEEKTLEAEKTENKTSSGQTGDEQGKPQPTRIIRRETENAAALKPQNLTGAPAELKAPQQKEMISADPLRSQTFTKTEVTAQIIEKAETMIQEDKSEMTMQLKPDSLGKISLKVIHERGEIIARFVAESEQVKAILESNMQMLKDSLQKGGMNVQSLEVSVGQQGADQQKGWDNRQNEGFAQQETKAPARAQRVFMQPIYGYSGSTEGYYPVQTSEIDLTA